MKKTLFIIVCVFALTVMATAFTASALTYDPETFEMYVEGAIDAGFVPDRLLGDMKATLTIEDGIDISLNFAKYKCGLDTDSLMEYYLKTAESEFDAKVCVFNTFSAAMLEVSDKNDEVDLELGLGLVSYSLGNLVVPSSPLIIYNNGFFSRHNYQNMGIAVSHPDAVMQLMVEVINMGYGIPDFSQEKILMTRDQFAALCFMFSDISLPRDLTNRYPGGVTGYSDVDEFVAEILNSIIVPNMSDRDKVQAIYDYMIKNFTHNDDAMPMLMGSDPGNPLYFDIQMAMPIIYTGEGTCDAFSSMFRLLAIRAGFECNYVSGQYINRDGTRLGHGCNQIKIDDEWFWVDVDVEGTNAKRNGYTSY